MTSPMDDQPQPDQTMPEQNQPDQVVPEQNQPEDAEMLGAPSPQSPGEQLERDPADWTTGDDPATEAQKSYLDRLASAAGEQISADGLTKAQASEHIDRLQGQTGMQPRES
ncbi:DUF3072 domain-containing protein [Serinicoccus profundi]|uniref:DUF3072 domain-containing protein n=1 Tax=Serinicoccus profundi TaxID=1078471 RepID=UPI000255E284